jgi:hypothetical protein
MFSGTDAHVLQKLQTFATGIAAAPATYFVSAPDATSITNAVNGFDTALTTAVTPATRNVGSVAAKDNSRAAAVALCRQYAILIKYNAGISDESKLLIGVKPPTTTRSPVGPPDEAPVIAVLGATFGSHTVRYMDPDGGDSVRKPGSATNLQVYRAIGPAAVTDEAATTFYNSFRRNPIAIEFDHADDGKVATYFARWANAKGEVGPWSAPVSMRIAA